ncbi:MAG: serine/threonine-protein phosphatase [Acidobacteria bacterium]|nr:serine/threonine-protein phosphatase [Acidobacteriota bacterium]
MPETILAPRTVPHPDVLVRPPDIGIDAISIPAGEFTGDFYFTEEVGGDFWFAVGDVAGKGLSASLLGALMKEELDRAIFECASSSPAELVARIHDVVVREMPGNRFVTAIVGRIDSRLNMTIVNAGHPSPLLVSEPSPAGPRGGSTVSIPSTGPVVGILPVSLWREESFRLRRGDRLVMYTDGLIEATSPDGEEIGEQRVLDILQGSDRESIAEELVAGADSFSNGIQSDDLTVVVLEVR